MYPVARTFRLALLLLVAIVVGCGKPDKKFVIAVSQCSEDVWRDKLNEELRALRESEMWQTAVTVRKLRPENN